VRALAAAIACAAAAVAPRAALAADEAEADLVRKGVELREKGEDAAALEVFREAYDKWKTPRARAQMGLAAQALGRWVEAEADLEGAIEQRDDPWIQTNRAALEGALGLVRQRLGSLEILCDAPGTRVTVDGRPRGVVPLPRPLRIPAGTVAVRVEAPGYAAVQRNVAVMAGRLSRETFHLMPLEPLPTAPSGLSARVRDEAPGGPAAVTPPPARRRWPPAVFWGAAAATAVVAGVTVWSGLDVLGAHETYRSNPTRDGYNDGRSRERRTNWLLGGTAVLAVSTALIGIFATDF
jgi:hypothetical protein